jgi:selenide,water dikinase
VPQLPFPKELLIGIETSDDAAVYQINESQAIVATTDFFMPIVDDPFDFGKIAATNAISDIYAMGATPLFALALVGMPIKVLSNRTIARILEGGAEACRSAGIPIAGGHTIDSVEPIYGLVAIGIVDPRQVKSNAAAKPGDILILGKPIGVGILSAALKKDLLSAQGYQEMIINTTKLNSAGPDLAKLPGVHALTDITGFGLAGHVLELARGSDCTAQINWSQVPLLSQVQELAEQEIVTGASDRNWQSYGSDVALPASFSKAQQALLTDPQTSGGLLVACSEDTVQKVLDIFKRHNFSDASVIGQISAKLDKPLVISR